MGGWVKLKFKCDKVVNRLQLVFMDIGHSTHIVPLYERVKDTFYYMLATAK